MEEKKLTDEEIVKALEVCAKDGNCLECLYFINGIDCCGQRSERDYLDLIHRLQSENKELQESADLFSEFNKKLNGVIAEQKAEIERLKDENIEERDIHFKNLCGYKDEIARLQKKEDELKEQLKTVQSSCRSKNEKIKNLNAEKEALQNELNFQNGKPHYRYVIWNTKQNERQFPSICELTEIGAYTKLFQKIGWDSAKYRFVVKRIKVEVDIDNG